jgi:ABC-type nitrate/sulfonate/bicarbonate transport system substrate-binding protein
MAERQQERAELVKRLDERANVFHGLSVENRVPQSRRKAYGETVETLRDAARLLEEDGQEIERLDKRLDAQYEVGRLAEGVQRVRAEKAEAELARITDILAELADLMDATVRGDYKPDSFTTQPARLALSPAHQGDQT